MEIISIIEFFEKSRDKVDFGEASRVSRGCVERERGRESLDKASIFAKRKSRVRARCSGALREEGRGTMHADPYSGRCYFRSILSIEEGRRTTWRASHGLCNEPLVFNARLAETRDPPCMRRGKKGKKKGRKKENNTLRLIVPRRY